MRPAAHALSSYRTTMKHPVAREIVCCRLTRTRVCEQPIQRIIHFGQCSALEGIVVMRAPQFDHAFLTGVCLNDEPVKTRRDDLVSFGEQKDRPRATRPAIRYAIELGRNLQRDGT